MESNTSPLALPRGPEIVITSDAGIRARCAGYLWWKRIEISLDASQSSYREAILAHERFHVEHFHNELFILMLTAFMTTGMALAAAQNWWLSVAVLLLWLPCQVAWSWAIEFWADGGAVRAGHGWKMGELLEWQDDSALTLLSHPPRSLRIARIARLMGLNG